MLDRFYQRSFLVLSLLTVPVSSLFAGEMDNKILSLTAQHSGKCLDVQGSSLESGAQAIQNSCASTESQKWTPVPVGSDRYQVKNVKSGMCLDVGGSSQVDGGLIKQSTCLGSSKLNQLWKMNLVSSGVYSFVSVNSSKCLDVPSRSLESGVQLIQWTCNGGANQAWKAAVIAPPASWGQSSAKLSVSVEFTTPEYTQANEKDRYDQMAAYEISPLVHFRGSSYYVWVDTRYRPWVTKVTNGKVQTVPLDPNPDYKTTIDGHGRFTLGIDKMGYIHVSGDMHNYTDASVEKYVPRYQKQAILYWKSVSRENISDGFAFAGGKGSRTAIPGTGYTYGRFFTDNYGELFYTARVKAIRGAHLSGEMGLGLYRYDTNSSTWTALGDYADEIRPSPNFTYHKVAFWENGGFASQGSGGWYQGIAPVLKFDLKNQLHMGSPMNTDTSLPGANRLVYAYSPDGGISWRRANGSPLAGSLVRAIDGHPSSGDIVFEDRVNAKLSLHATGFADSSGKPAAFAGGIWRVWDGSKWKPDTTVRWSDKGGSLAPNGALVLLSGNSIVHTMGFGKPVYTQTFSQYSKLVTLDEATFRSTGVMYVIGISPGSKTQSILRITAN